MEESPGISKHEEQRLALVNGGVRWCSSAQRIDQRETGDLTLKDSRAHDGELPEENDLHFASHRHRRFEDGRTKNAPIERLVAPEQIVESSQRFGIDNRGGKADHGVH